MYLQGYKFYKTNDGRTVYLQDRVGRSWGEYGGRVEGLPGMQIWGTTGGGHIGTMAEWYQMAGYAPNDALSLVSEATEEDIARYAAYSDVPLDKSAIETFVSYHSLSVWIAAQTSPLEDFRRPGVAIVKEYLSTYQGDAFDLIWNSWYNGYNRYSVIVGMEFIGERYLRLPNHFHWLQRRERDDKKTYQELFFGAFPGEKSLVWGTGKDDLSMFSD